MNRINTVLCASTLVFVNIANMSIRTTAKPIEVRKTPVVKTVSSEEVIVIESDFTGTKFNLEETNIIPVVEPELHIYYTVNGSTLDYEFQSLLREELKKYGTEWFLPYAMCQIYQESKFNPSAVSKNGLDRGLCQFRRYYFKEFATDAGLPNADVFNPRDSIMVYAHLMSKYLKLCNDDVEMALSYYYLGEKKYCEHYVHEVMQWWDTLKEL